MSWYEAEQEVLCLPMFTFQVVNVVQDTKLNKYKANGEIVMAKLTTVTLVELPYQNMLKVREVVPNAVIWFDEPEPEKTEEAIP
jgi:hypothetical protein